MFLAVNHANGSLNCAGREPTSFSSGSAYTWQLPALLPIQDVVKISNGHRPPKGLSLVYVHDITPEPLQILPKWDTSGDRRIVLAISK